MKNTNIFSNNLKVASQKCIVYWQKCKNYETSQETNGVILCNVWNYEVKIKENIKSLEEKYLIASNQKTIQLCPNCGEFVSKSQLWNHLYCNKWQFCFWIYWRRKFSNNHMNPLYPDSWPSLVKHKKTRPVSKMPALVMSTFWKTLLIVIFLLLLSPLITIIIFPYLLTLWCTNRYTKNVTKLLIFLLNIVGTIWWFPILWMITIWFYFYIMWSMKSYQKHARVKIEKYYYEHMKSDSSKDMIIQK